MDRRARVGLALAAGLAALGLLLVAAAGTARWVTAVPQGPELPGASRVPLKGSTLVPAALPLALVGVAGILAAATAGRIARGALRLAAACLVVAAGVGIVLLTGAVLTSPGDAVRSTERARQANATGTVQTSAIGWAATAGGLAFVAAGGVALRHRRGWPGLAARYERADEAGAGWRPRRPAESTRGALGGGGGPHLAARAGNW